MNSAATAPSRVRPRRRGVFPAVRRSGAARRSSARGANANPAGQTLSPVRRVGRPSPWGAFLRGANPFARAPCREAFAEGRVPARANPFARAPCREAFAEESVPALGKPFRPCAVSGGLRRGERSCAGQILSLVRRVGRPSLRGVFLRGQILSLVRRVGRPSPRGEFLRGQILFAFAPCREAFVEESLLARGKSCLPPRGIGKPWRAIGSPPRGAR